MFSGTTHVLLTGEQWDLGYVVMKEPFGMEDHSDGTPTYSVDPVCGMRVEEKKAAAKTSYAGQTYYFCSKDCQRNFELSPAQYIGQRV